MCGDFYFHLPILMTVGVPCQPTPSPGSNAHVGSWGTGTRVTPEHVVPQPLQLDRQPSPLWS